MQKIGIGLGLPLLLAFAGETAAQDLLRSAEAVKNAGGSTFSINAMNAIQATCLDLVANSRQNEETPEQTDLRVNCGNMVFTTLSVLDEVDDNRYGFATESEIYNSIRQFSGEEVSSQGRYATETTNRQFSLASARLAAIRQGSRGASGLTFNLQGMDIIASETGSGQGTPLVGGSAGEAGTMGDTGFAWFGNVDYGFGDRDGTANEDDYEFDAYEISFGVDYAWGNGWVLGGILSLNDHEVDFDSGSSPVSEVAGGSMESDGYTLSAFGQYQSNQFYLSGIVSIGNIEHDMDRVVRFTSNVPGTSPNRLMLADTESDQLAGQFTAGWLLGRNAVTTDLYVGVDYLNIEVDSFTESETSAGGGLNLAFGGQDIDSVQSIVGARIQRAMNTGGGVLVPYLGLEYRHEFDNDARVVDARYAQALGDIDGNGASINFAMPTDDPDSDFGEVTLGLSFQRPNNLLLFLQVQSAVGLNNANMHLITAGIRGSF